MGRCLGSGPRSDNNQIKMVFHGIISSVFFMRFVAHCACPALLYHPLVLHLPTAPESFIDQRLAVPFPGTTAPPDRRNPMTASPYAGPLYILKATFWFSLGNILVKLAGSELPFMEIVLGRSLVGLALCLFFLRGSGVSSLGHDRRMLLYRGGSGFIALACSFYALVHLPMADAIVLFYTNPVFAALLGFLILKERLGPRSIACILISLTGVILVARPSFLFAGTAGLHPLNTAIALTAAFFAGLSYVIMHDLGRREHPLVIVMALYLVSAPLSLLFSLPGWQWPTGYDLLLIAGIGTLTQFGQFYLTRALSVETAGRATAMANIHIVFVALWGVIIFNEIPDHIGIFGTLLIVGSTTWLAMEKSTEKRHDRS